MRSASDDYHGIGACASKVQRALSKGVLSRLSLSLALGVNVLPEGAMDDRPGTQRGRHSGNRYCVTYETIRARTL
jgi:hypothetical protein